MCGWIPRPTILIVLSWFILNSPLLLGFRVLPGDALNEFYPMVYFSVESIRAGAMPWWNPYIFSGYPQAADPQSMLFSPLMTGWMLLIPRPGTTWFVWAVLLHVLAGGLGFAGFLRHLRINSIGTMLGTLVFMFGGVAASRLQHVPIVVAYGFLGITLLCIVRFFDRPGLSRALPLALAGAGMAIQPVQLTLLAFWVLSGVVVVKVASGWRKWPRRERVRVIAGLAVAGGACVLLVAPQLILTTAFLAVSNRPVLDLMASQQLSMTPGTLTTILVPNALQALRGTYAGAGDAIEAFMYVGAFPGAMLIHGAFRWRRLRQFRKHAFYAFAVFAASILYAVGDHTPFYTYVYHVVPGVNLFRRPSDALYLANLALAILVAVASQAWNPVAHRARRLVFAGAFLIASVASFTMHGDGEGWFIPSILAPLAVAGCLIWTWWRCSSRTIVLAVIACVGVDYRCFNLNGEFNQFRDTPGRYVGEDAVRFLAGAVRTRPDGIPPRIEATGLGAVWKNMGVVPHLQGTQGYGPLRWRLYDEWYGVYGEGNGPRPSTSANPSPDRGLNELLGVRYVVSPAEAPAFQAVLPIYQDEKVQVHEMASVLPRVLTPSRASLSAHGAGLTALARDGKGFADEVVLIPRTVDEVDTLRQLVSQCGAPSTITDVAWSHGRHAFVVESAGMAWTSIAELDFPGWIARIDGEEAMHYRANGIFRAICVPRGRHVVTFDFDPFRMVKEVVSRPGAWR